MAKFTQQYNILGLKPPSKKMDAREKAEVIFHAACKIHGLDPAALPLVDHLEEEFRPSLVSSYKLQVVRKAITAGRKGNWNDTSERKWGSWFWMNKPGFRFYASHSSLTRTYAAGGSRLCTFSEEDQDFFAQECIAFWADFHGEELPA